MMTLTATTKNNESMEFILATDCMFREENGIIKARTIELKSFQAFIPTYKFVKNFIANHVRVNEKSKFMKKNKAIMDRMLFDKLLNDSIILRVNYRDYNNTFRCIEQVVYIPNDEIRNEVIECYLNNPNILAKTFNYECADSEFMLMSLYRTLTTAFLNEIIKEAHNECEKLNAA